MKILVVGDYISDVYTFGTATRLCPEAPVPVLIPEVTRVSAGGAGLVYSQLVKLGADVTPLYLSHSEKHRYFAGSHLICRVDHDSISKSDRHFSNLQPFAGFDVIVVSDYGKGAMTRDLAAQLRSTGKMLFVDAKHHWDWYESIHSIAFPNEHEQPSAYGYWQVAHKLGANGCKLWCENTMKLICLAATVSEVVDTTGAGDIFMASFVYAWTLQLPPEDCLRFANELAGESCRHRGTFVVGKEFAQSVLDRLRVSAGLQQQIPDCSRYSTPAGHQLQHAPDHSAYRASAFPEADNLRASLQRDLTIPSVEEYNRFAEQTRLQSPSVPTESSDTQTPSDQEIAGASDSGSRSEQPSQNSTETERQCDCTLGPDQGWIG